MLNRRLLLSSLLIFLLLFSCSKDEKNKNGRSIIAASITIDEAKSLYLRQPGIIVNSNENGYLGTPNWNKTLSIRVSNKASALKVALNNSDLNHTTFRDLVFTKDKYGIMRCQVFEVLLHPGYLVQKQKEKGAGLNIRNYIDDADFTGLLVLYNVNGSIIKGRKYEDGQLKSELEFDHSTYKSKVQAGGPISNTHNNKKSPSLSTVSVILSKVKTESLSSEPPKQKACKQDSDCDGSSTCVKGVCIWIMNINTVVVVGHGVENTIPPPTVFDWTIPIVISPIPGMETLPSNGTGSGSSDAGGLGLGVAWPGAGEPSALFVADSTASPCIKAALKLAMDRGLKNEITNTFLDLFSGDKSRTPPYFNSIIRDGVLRADIDATTRTYVNDISKPIEIVLNSSTLANASKEFIVAAFLHESIHAMYDAIILKNQSDKLLFSGYIQHNLMADKYVVKMSVALREIFPSLGDFDAKALAWRGLQDGVSWKALNPSVANKLLLAAEEFDQYHNKGTRCPQD